MTDHTDRPALERSAADRFPSFRPPLTVRRKGTDHVLLTAPVPASLARLRETVQYEGEELVLAHLCYEIVEHADLSGADLRGLFLYSALFSHVDFTGADLTGAHLRDTAFLDCPTLAQAVGLDRVEHDGASCLDRGTLSACAASLPDAFLAGTGYSLAEVQALRALYPAP